ncbi:hypothetical protein [Lactobacillus crispatus]|uniref:hypothetical protein n=1 Tax=Lactobacillus crispatus TaxID=47770 RepID=UPI0022E2838A|nr:hypothetical protein [Lactobacillus crispatus]
MSVDIYNEKLEPYDDGKRHKFSGTFDRLNDRLAIFKDLRIAGAGGNPIVKQLALHYLKTFKDLDLKRGDVVEFEGMVEKDSNNGFTIERPTQAKKSDQQLPMMLKLTWLAMIGIGLKIS